MRKWLIGMAAAVVIGVAAGIITRLLDSEAPYAVIGGFWAVLAFLVGAGGAARLAHRVPDPTDVMHY